MTEQSPLLITFKSLTGFAVRNGGKRTGGGIHDVLVDDRPWGIRYLVVDRGLFRPGPRLLVAPEQVQSVGLRPPEVLLDRSEDVLERAPDIDFHPPVSRRFRRYPPALSVAPMAVPPRVSLAGAGAAAPAAEAALHPGDPNLRSIREIVGYRLETADNRAGRIVDVVLDVAGWRVAWLVVRTRLWLPGTKVLVPPFRLRDVDWTTGVVESDLTWDGLKASPDFHPDEPVNHRREIMRYDYRGDPR